MLADLYSYLWTLAGYAKWLLTGGPFLVDALAKRYRPEWAAWLDRWLHPETRKRLEIGILVSAIFFAGFLAWRDEHNLRLTAEGHHTVGRRLKDAEKQAIRKGLENHIKELPFILVSSVGTTEAQRFAYDFVQLFSDMGIIAGTNLTTVPVEETDTGLMIGLANPENPSDAAKLFISIMLSTGLSIKQVKFIEINGVQMPVDFDLFIGDQ